MSFHENRFNNGFTLVELLVVIAIIALLLAVATTAYSNAQKQVRDSTREQNFSAFREGLELYRHDQGSYPSAWNLNGSADLNNPAGTVTYIKDVPKDPLPSNPNYKYVPLPGGCSGSGCNSYCLYAKFESILNQARPSSCSNDPNYNYVITSP